jgi:hypothetical protein
MPDYERHIKSLDEFKALSNLEKGIYISALQSTYHVSLNEIAYSMKGASENPKSFINYLSSCGIHGDRRLGSMSTAVQWSGFITGVFDIYGGRILDGRPTPAPRKPDPSPPAVEIMGAPKSLLNILSVIFSSPDILASPSYRVLIQEAESP